MKHPDDNKTIDMMDKTFSQLDSGIKAMEVESRRGRKPLVAAEPVTDVVDTAALVAAGQAATALVLHQQTIADQYGNGLPYQRERVVQEAAFFMAQSAEAMLEVGKRLITLKENETHGEFIEIVENRLGIGRRTAQRMMAASIKYLSPRLASKATPVTLLGRAKLFDLMTESDEDIEQLASGGTLAGHTLDELEQMTRREMQAAIRDYKQRLEAKDKVLADRNEKLQAAEERLHRPYKPSKHAAARNEREKSALDVIRTAATAMNGALLDAAQVLNDLAEQDGISQSCHDAARNDLVWVAHRLAAVMREHGIELDLAAEIVPSWVTETKARQQGGA